MVEKVKNKGMLAKKFALGFGIAVIFPFMVHYGVRTFSPEPRWEDFQIQNYYARYQAASQEEKQRLEDAQNQLQKKHREAEKAFQKHLFFVAAPVGILAIILGALITVQAIGSGLMFGGIFCLMDGYVNYWSELHDALRFLSLLIAFLLLLFVGFKKMNDR